MLDFLYGLYHGLVAALAAALGPWRYPPLSTVFIFTLAIILGVASSIVTKMLVDMETLRRYMEEVNAWQKQYIQAMKSGDKKTLAKLKKREPAIKRMRAEMTRQQMKPFAVTFIPFVFLWWLFNGVFMENGAPIMVAHLPFPLPFLGANLTFIWWYILSSFSITSLIQKVLNVSTIQD